MDSLILENLLIKRDNDSVEDINRKKLYEILNSICSNSQFNIFKEVMSNVKDEYFIEDNIHGISHNERVAVLAMYIALKEGLSDEDLRLVLKAAIYHDIGRKSHEKNHGKVSADLLLQNKAVLAPELGEHDLNVVRFLCESHNINDKNASSVIDTNVASKYGLQTSAELVKMVKILKDADALDRVRLPRFGKIDVSYLRTETSKELVELAKTLFLEYKNIQYSLGEKLNTSVFDLDKANVIEDEENYYVFRTLNEENIADLDNPELSVMRTKGQFARETRGEETKYGPDDTISLEEVYTNIRIAKSGKNNNCISFSTNPNVNLDYESGKYIMYAIPKTGDPKIQLAGKYMLEEINKRIAHKLVNGNIPKEIRDILLKIDSENSTECIKSLVGESFDKFSVSKEKKSYTGKSIVSNESLISRFESKQFFNSTQELEYNKIIAKLTVLETNGYLRSILSTQANNSNLIAAVGGAFSSSEVIHYGEIEKDKIISVSEESLKLFALLQQADNILDVDKKQINLLKRLILESIKEGQKLVESTDGENSNANASDNINLNPENIREYLVVNDGLKSIIPYAKGSVSLQYIYEYAKAKKETFELIDSLRENLSRNRKMNSNMELLLDTIMQSTIIPKSSIISRRNNSGIKIADTVNLDLNSTQTSKVFSEQEQIDLISLLRTLSREDIELIASGNLNVIKEKGILSQSLTAKDYVEGLNEYYIDYILDSIELEKIYKVSNVRDEKKNELREKLENKLKEFDIRKLYESFIEAGIAYSDVPNYIVNLLLENGCGEISLEELIEQENLATIIKENINMFTYRITPFAIDNYLQILDNNYHVPGSSIVLREYQEIAVKEIDRIFETRNFAGVVLPTGAGKSFVAMAELLKKPKQNILYFAPQEGILNQVQKHILKHILGKTILSEEDIDLMIEMSDEERRTFLSTKVYNQDTNIGNELTKLKKAKTDEERKSIKNKMLPRSTNKNDDIMDAIHTVFPHLDMYCYQSLNSKEYQKILEKKKDLIVFDELHRTGAETWRPLIKEMINSSQNVKILGITATPNRDDANHTDMMKYMAEHYGGFSEDEIIGKEYLAQEMYLTDAMQNKYVVEPKIVSFNFTLAETEQYKFVKETLEAETKKSPDSELVAELSGIKDEMDSIIYGGNKEKKKNLSSISKVLEDVIPEKLRNGRFIVFLEHNARESGLTAEEYMKQQIDLVCKYFAGVNSNINADYLLSSRKKADNLKAIQDFESLDTDYLKLLFAIDMLNEGIHVDNINGELMLRPIGEGSNILYFQQIGRVIFGIDPENPPKEDEVPIIFDVYNNYLTRDLNRTANITTTTSDLNNIRLVANWIQKHERMPDINSSKHDEARKAIILKKIQEKYEKYVDGINNDNLSPTERKEIEKILEIATMLNLFEANIGERIIPPGEKELGRVNAFEIKGDVKNFLDLFKKSKKALSKAKRNVKVSDTLRIRTTMSILQVLNEYGFEISDEQLTKVYRKINKNTNLTQEEAKENLKLLDLINNSFSESTRQRVIEDLDMDIEELEEFKIYSEFDYARAAFSSKKKNIRNIFSVYSIEEIRKTGILKENGEFISSINQKGFVLENAPDLFLHLNIYTGTKFGLDKFDVNGYDLDGYDKDGYDKGRYDKKGFHKYTLENKYHFRRNGINVKTNTHLDEHGFDIDGIYWAPNPEYPEDFSKRINTHKKVNEYNFNRDGIWFREDKNGELIRAGTEDDRGFKAFEEVSKYKFRRDGFNIETQSYYDLHGFDYDKIHKDTKTEYDIHDFDIDGLDRKTGSMINNKHFDRYGYYYKYNRTWQEWINTNTFYDEQGRDIDGLDEYGVDKNGVCHFTEGVNERGFNQKKIHIVTKSIIDENGLDYDGVFWEEYGDTLRKTVSRYGKNQLTKDGIDKRGFRVSDGWNIETNSWVDKNNWDINGFLWDENENGELVNTGLKYDEEGYNFEGINKYGFNRKNKYVLKTKSREYKKGKEVIVDVIRLVDRDPFGFNFEGKQEDGALYDKNGFDFDGIHKDTKLPVNKYGFNRYAYYCEKDENGNWISTELKCNPRGFDIDRKYHELSSDGSRKNYAFFDSYYDEEGYDIDELDRHRFNKARLYVDEDGNEHVVNPYGFGFDGFIYVLNEGTGKYEKTYRTRDAEGYDFDGLDEEKFDRNHLYKGKQEWDDYGFNYLHIHTNGTKFDEFEFDYLGIHKKTKTIYDKHFFDRDGYFYKKDEKTGEYVKTDSKINDEHFDRKGYWYKEKDGQLVRTGRKTNPEGKNIDGLLKDEAEQVKKAEAAEERQAREEQKKLERQAREEQKRLERQAREKQKEEEKRAREEAKTRKSEEDADKLRRHKEKFDENGICISTNLPYDEFYFDVNGMHVVTKTMVDYRGFKCTGECIRNKGLPYDKNGFKQDGTHIETGEKYYNGLNAYGVDENGETKNNNHRRIIRNAKKFIEANFNFKNTRARAEYLKSYSIAIRKTTEKEVLQEINREVFQACEMYPALREEIIAQVKRTQTALIGVEMKIRSLRKNQKENESEIARNEKIANILKERMKILEFDEREK